MIMRAKSVKLSHDLVYEISGRKSTLFFLQLLKHKYQHLLSHIFGQFHYAVVLIQCSSLASLAILLHSLRGTSLPRLVCDFTHFILFTAISHSHTLSLFFSHISFSSHLLFYPPQHVRSFSDRPTRPQHSLGPCGLYLGGILQRHWTRQHASRDLQLLL